MSRSIAGTVLATFQWFDLALKASGSGGYNSAAPAAPSAGSRLPPSLGPGPAVFVKNTFLDTGMLLQKVFGLLRLKCKCQKRRKALNFVC